MAANTGYIIIIAILAVMVIAFLIWALVTRAQLESKEANLIQNPYCLRVACGQQPQYAYQIPLEDDPQRLAYATLNWCTVNAPPTQFIQVVEKCDFGPQDQQAALLRKFIEWYPYNYTPECGNNWKTLYEVPLANEELPGGIQPSPNTEPDSESNPNNPVTLNGINDEMALACKSCAAELAQTDPNWLPQNFPALQELIRQIENPLGV